MQQHIIDEHKIIEDKLQSGLRLDLNLPWAEVLHLATRYDYSKRTRIHFSEDMNRDFYYISKGQLCLQVSSVDGKERLTNYFGAGCLFNLATVFYESFNDFGAWLFLEDSTIWRFPGRLLKDREFVLNYPELMINLVDSFCFTILTQYTWLTEMYLAVPTARVARYLIGLSVAEGSTNCFVGVTQQDAARQLGIHRGTLSSTLKSLKEQGVLAEFSRGHLHILEPERLRKIAFL